MSVSVRDLKIEMTLSVGELGEIADLLSGAIEAIEGANDKAPDVYYQLVEQYDSLMRELNEAIADTFGVE